MRAYDRERRERDWGDGVGEGPPLENGAETYRDGSLKNECWQSGDYTKQRKMPPKAPKKAEKKP